MKRIFLIVLAILLGISVSAQTYRYRATQLAIGERSAYSGNIIWGDWQKVNVIITINLDNDYIKVYSAREQNYVIVKYKEKTVYDKYGGESLNMTAVDEEGIECDMSLRVQSDGIAQLYSYYNNSAWVYSNLERL